MDNWGHPAYKLPPEANLMAVAHYLEALDIQREIIKIQVTAWIKKPPSSDIYCWWTVNSC